MADIDRLLQNAHRVARNDCRITTHDRGSAQQGDQSLVCPMRIRSRVAKFIRSMATGLTSLNINKYRAIKRSSCGCFTTLCCVTSYTDVFSGVPVLIPASRYFEQLRKWKKSNSPPNSRSGGRHRVRTGPVANNVPCPDMSPRYLRGLLYIGMRGKPKGFMLHG